MIKKMFTYVLPITIFLLVAFVPVFAKSASWSFTIKNRIVDGSDNDKYYNLAKGNIKIKGTLSSTKQNNNYGGNTPNPITICVYRDRLGPDKYIGSIEIKNTRYSSFDKKIGTADYSCRDYYIVAYKTEMDYWTSSGKGTIYNAN